MNRLWLGVAILLLVLAAGLGVAWGLTAAQGPISEALTQAAALAQEDQWQEAAALSEEAQGRWERFWHLSASVADHGPMEEIDALFSELAVCREEADTQEFALRCARLSRLVRAMSDAHRLSWWNLL